MRPVLGSVLVLAACGGAGAGASADSDSPASPTCDTPGERVGVVASFSIPPPDDAGRLDGFDLDDDATRGGDATGCGIADDADLRGRPGVDAALNHLLVSPALQATELVGLDGLVQTAIDQGDLLVLFRMLGFDDPVDDDCVRLELVRGVGEPVVGAPGLLTPDQTFDVDPAVPITPIGEVPIHDGTVEGGPFTLPFPVTILGSPIELTLLDARVRLHLQADGAFTGAIAGGIALDDLLSVARTQNVDPAVAAALEGAIGFWADLDADGDGRCERISIHLALTGVPAFLFAGPPDDTGLGY